MSRVSVYEISDLLVCECCGVEAGEPCVSKKGYIYLSFAHKVRFTREIYIPNPRQNGILLKNYPLAKEYDWGFIKKTRGRK